MLSYMLASLASIIFSPTMFAVLGIWLVFAAIVGIFRILGWIIGAGLRVFWWLFVASLVLGFIGFAPAIILALVGAIVGCMHPTRR